MTGTGSYISVNISNKSLAAPKRALIHLDRVALITDVKDIENYLQHNPSR